MTPISNYAENTVYQALLPLESQGYKIYHSVSPLGLTLGSRGWRTVIRSMSIFPNNKRTDLLRKDLSDTDITEYGNEY